MAGIGKAIKGIGKVLNKFKSRGRNVESKKIFEDAKKGKLPKKGKYPAIDKALKNIKKSGNIFGE